MALVGVPIAPGHAPPPREVAEFSRAADRRIDAFHRRRTKRPLHSFVPSDLLRTWRMLDAIARQELACGRSFCEWGCGFAAVAGLSTFAGFDACGIEIELDLVAEARRLMHDFELDVALAHGNFIPRDLDDGPEDETGELSGLARGGPDGHAVLRRDPDRFDVVFAYPWPGEEDRLDALFDAVAKPGALLLTSHGEEPLRLRRRVADGPARHERPGIGRARGARARPRPTRP